MAVVDRKRHLTFLSQQEKGQLTIKNESLVKRIKEIKRENINKIPVY